METVIINGISAEKIKQVKFYIRIVSNRYQEDLQNVPELPKMHRQLRKKANGYTLRSLTFRSSSLS